MRPDKIMARAAGISKHFRRYAQRYGAAGVKYHYRLDDMIAMHKKFPVLKLNHARDRQLKKMNLPALPPRVVIEGLPHAA